MSDDPDRTEVTWHEQAVSRSARAQLMGHRGCAVWFTGLSGSGKSTVANALDHLLFQRGFHSYLLDGDNVRHGLNASREMLCQEYGLAHGERFGLGFSPQDRQENIRRIAAVAQLFVDAGLITLTAFVSPYQADRDAARRTIVQRGGPDDFIEVFVDTPLEICERRDPKGLYRKARSGELPNFTGISAPYETPQKPELVLEGGRLTASQLAEQVLEFLKLRGVIVSIG